MATAFDFIIVGGGAAGCVVASRLHEAFPKLSIALVEAGEDATSNPMVQDPRAAQALHDTDLQWKYTSTPQAHLDGRTLPNWGGKLLSGSSAVNYTAWSRGHAADYDQWAEQVGDSRWSFNSMLPAFKRSEHWHGSHGDPQAHGFDGPIRTQSGEFGFPLREPIKKAFQWVGFTYNPDLNSGNPNGVSPLRQHAAGCYSLEGVSVLCNKIVSKINFDQSGRATGVRIDGTGEEFWAKKEVIVSCGGIRTPQLLLLSGIGPKEELEAHHISAQIDSPEVGKNFLDHHAVTMFWRLKNPEEGLALGAPSFDNPSFANSLPIDWFVSGSAPDGDMKNAAAIDGTNFVAGPRTDFELTPMYLTNGAVPDPWLAFDGNHISCGVACLSSTSRGTVKLRSTDPTDNPVLDPNAVSSEHDRAVLRAGMRAVINAMSSPAMSSFIGPNEIPPPGGMSLSKTATDEELDQRIRAVAVPWFHAAGTAAMGRVVDSECRVKGARGLRVVDTSIMPLSITAHLQAPVYALAEQAASIISSQQNGILAGSQVENTHNINNVSTMIRD